MDLAEAISSHRCIEFTYQGHHRVVIPMAYGRTSASNAALRAYQTAGTSSSGPIPSSRPPSLFLEDQMVDARYTGATFSAPPDGYSRGDKGFVIIYAEL